MTAIQLNNPGFSIQIEIPPDAPATLSIPGSFVTSHALVDVFTAAEQRARTSQGYVRSAVGERLRYVDHRRTGQRLELDQADPSTGIVVTSVFDLSETAAAVRVQHVVKNTGSTPVVVTAVTSAVLGLGETETDLDALDLLWGESEWLAEGRWHEKPLRSLVPRLDLKLHAQDGRGRFSLTSHGAWSTGEFLPGGILTDRQTRRALAWQIESSGAWHWEIGQTLTGGFLSLVGPVDTEHHFAERLEPGAIFTSVSVGLAVSDSGRDGALAELTRYRRSLRALRPIDHTLPIVYNDFMNTLMGDPSTEALEPLIDAAAESGAEYFCIDAGWFAEPGVDWWDGVGEWQPARTRFSGGLGGVIDRIRRRGMVPGLWLEPEVVGITSSLAQSLPAEAFFSRFGERVREHDRFHLDFRHPAAIAHVDATVDRLVLEFGVQYFKLDYNINPGPGTDHGATAAGAGLLAHNRAYRSWLIAAQERHPDVLFESCSSGAMRMDYDLLSVAHLQSTSDQQDYLLYPPIAASAPASMAPEQAGNWAYPSADMTREETIFSLVAGLAGRLYLSGFVDRLSAEQRQLVAEAVLVSKEWRARVAVSVPFWPRGLPGWDDELIAVGLDCQGERLLAVWNRGTENITWPGEVEVVFPAGASAELPPGPSARLFRLLS